MSVVQYSAESHLPATVSSWESLCLVTTTVVLSVSVTVALFNRFPRLSAVFDAVTPPVFESQPDLETRSTAEQEEPERQVQTVSVGCQSSPIHICRELPARAQQLYQCGTIARVHLRGDCPGLNASKRTHSVSLCLVCLKKGVTSYSEVLDQLV